MIRNFKIAALFVLAITNLLPTHSNALISTGAFIIGGSAAAKTAMIASAITAGTGGALIGAGFLGARFSKEWEPYKNPLYYGLIAGWIILPIGVIVLSESDDSFALQFNEAKADELKSIGFSDTEVAAFSDERLQINAVMIELFQSVKTNEPETLSQVAKTWESIKSSLSDDAIHAVEKLTSKIILR